MNFIIERRLSNDVLSDTTHKDLLYAIWIKNNANRNKIQEFIQKFEKHRSRVDDMKQAIQNDTDIFEAESQRIIVDNENTTKRLMYKYSLSCQFKFSTINYFVWVWF